MSETQRSDPPTEPIRFPDLDRVRDDLRADAAAGHLALWGTSTVVDELAGVPVLEQQRFDQLHAAAGIRARFPVGNAGVLHVYGYWFSTIVTAHGLKRDRWVDGRLAGAFGLAPEGFHLGDGRTTTLLRRVTDVALPLLLDPPWDAATADVEVEGRHTRTVLHRAAGARTTALLYGVDEGAGLRLITTFPVDGDPQPLLDASVAVPRLRWNAAPAGS
ncbi:amino acid deaminase [Agrococcus sp. KRD186]|uniref:amino acid deaminase n=1 Tax=Agrococcus sp. KRD186 TaxID=2729730 RepID=UPI0019D1D8EC|nr:amino acid deaminase [Agrococcus sp. KRD186]